MLHELLSIVPSTGDSTIWNRASEKEKSIHPRCSRYRLRMWARRWREWRVWSRSSWEQHEETRWITELESIKGVEGCWNPMSVAFEGEVCRVITLSAERWGLRRGWNGRSNDGEEEQWNEREGWFSLIFNSCSTSSYVSRIGLWRVVHRTEKSLIEPSSWKEIISVRARGRGVVGAPSDDWSDWWEYRLSGRTSANWVVLREQAVAMSHGYSGYTILKRETQQYLD